MIRLTLLWLYVFGLSAYAWRDWYRSLCGLILLMAVVEHPDMPNSLFGIQGLNPWNILMLAVLAAWLYKRGEERLYWDMPRHVTALLVLYMGVIVAGFFRMLVDRDALDPEVFSTGAMWSEYFVNALKWPIPALLLFDGARTRERLATGLFSILGLYVALAIQVIKWMPHDTVLSGSELSFRALKIIPNEIGYSRVSMSMLLAGGSWAVLAAVPLMKRMRDRLLVLGAFLAVSYGQALTGGRMGYLTWVAIGLVLGVLRWRRYLLLAPAAAFLVAWLVPGAVERMLEGFNKGDDDLQEHGIDEYAVTSGRTVAWPYVVGMIRESPIIGYGQQAMIRTGIAATLGGQGEAFHHPHNAYLELLLDSGIVGFMLVFPFYVAALAHSGRLFVFADDPMETAVGGAACALVLALLVASFGSQTFYPRPTAVGMWAAIGLALRLSVERSWRHAAARAWRYGASPAAARTAATPWGSRA
jgi:O-antigen ligase